MTKGTKILLGAIVGVTGMIVIAVAAVVGVAYWASNPVATKLYDEALIEGPLFGAHTDQQGCLDEGLARGENTDTPDVAHRSANDRFIRECLETSKPVEGFCEGVPSIPYFDWIESQCKKRGKQGLACSDAYDAKHTYCNF